MIAPAAMDAASAASLLDLEQLHAATETHEGIRSEASIPPAYRSIRAFIREPAFADAGRIWEVLKPLSPQSKAPSSAVNACCEGRTRAERREGFQVGFSDLSEAGEGPLSITSRGAEGRRDHGQGP